MLVHSSGSFLYKGPMFMTDRCVMGISTRRLGYAITLRSTGFNQRRRLTYNHSQNNLQRLPCNAACDLRYPTVPRDRFRCYSSTHIMRVLVSTMLFGKNASPLRFLLTGLRKLDFKIIEVGSTESRTTAQDCFESYSAVDLKTCSGQQLWRWLMFCRL